MDTLGLIWYCIGVGVGIILALVVFTVHHPNWNYVFFILGLAIASLLASIASTLMHRR